MRHWWVNQNQTFRQEIEGGYLWSPKRNKNGHRNPFYEFMREVSPGDIVFSFCDTRIAALGIVSGYGRESRLNVRSTVLCSQLPVDKWHAYLGEPTLANAILDRLVHHSHRIQLKTGGATRCESYWGCRIHRVRPRLRRKRSQRNDGRCWRR